ncbi:MAG TPA: thioredoxin domain-containing protein [Chroococcidiopsis sp.]
MLIFTACEPRDRESLDRESLDRESLELEPRNRESLSPESGQRESSWLTLTEQNFHGAVLQVAHPVLVDCWATWCMPRRPAHPVLSTLAEQFADRITIGRLNIANSARLAARYGIRAVPTLLLFSHGQVVHRTIGAPCEEAIAHRLTSLLSAPVSSQQVVSYR